jgi:ADP-ribose pyrophosphatase
VIEFYIAEELTHVGQRLDDGEFLDVAEMSTADLIAALDRGELTDAKTVAALLMYVRQRGPKWSQRES